MNRLRPEAQMRDRLRARLVRIVDEVALRMQPGVLGDDLHAVLVGAHRAVGAEAVEHRLYQVGRLDPECRIRCQAGMRHVVVDADGEAVAGLAAAEFVEHRLRHRRVEVLRRKPIAATDHQRHGRAAARALPPVRACSPHRDTAARPARPIPWFVPARRPRVRCPAAPRGTLRRQTAGTAGPAARRPVHPVRSGQRPWRRPSPCPIPSSPPRGPHPARRGSRTDGTAAR